MTDRELMQQALDALEYASDQTKPENLNGCDCLICTTILALRDRLAQPEQEPVTGNLLKDAYNAMVEKKTRSQKLREAGFTRRPKGWEKEKDEQEPVAWANEIIKNLHALYDSEMIKENDSGDALIRLDAAIAAVEEAEESHKAPPQRPWVGLTDEEVKDFQVNKFIGPNIIRAIERRLKEKNA